MPLEYEEASPRIEAERKRRDRLYAVLEQTTAYFERLLWDGDAGRPSARTSRSGAQRRSRGVPARAVARPGPGRGAAERRGSRDELRAAGLATVRGSDYFHRD